MAGRFADVTIEGVGAMISALRAMSKLAQTDGRAASQRIATDETRRIVAAAPTRQARLAARSVRTVRGSQPGIEAGGSRRVRSDVAGSDVFFGAEFGGQARRTTQQFPPYRRGGYWFFPTLRADEDRMTRQWASVLDVLAKRWAD